MGKIKYGVSNVHIAVANDDGNGTFNRYKKMSFTWYKGVIESNGESLFK